MSAHVISKLHVDLMVRAAIHARQHQEKFRWWRVDEEGRYAGWSEIDEFAETMPSTDEWLERKSPSQVGQMLVSECVMSVHHRYPDDDPDVGELPGPIDAYYMGPYVYENPGYTLTPGEVFRAIDYYDYQSCEHDGWRTSEAYAFCRSLRERYCAKVEGYEAAPWGFDDLGGRPREFSRRII